MKTTDELREDKKRADRAYCRTMDKADVEAGENLMNEAEARQVMEGLYREYHEVRITYEYQLEDAIAEAKKLLEPLRAASEDARAAYHKSLDVLMEYTTPSARRTT